MSLPRLLLSCVVITVALRGATEPPRLCVPGASSEAVALYDFLLEVSGKHTLSGQHCVPLVGDTRLPTVQKAFGHYPAVFSQDFGFSEPGTWDGINYRQRIVDDAIRRHAEGFIINLMWHAVRPTDDEPVAFEKSIQGKLTDAEWRELLTPGTALNERWQSQVDVIAFFLRQLRDARVPVLWRPYHEMNGSWFWWGGRPGADNFTKLYRMLFDRLTHFHRLNNLIWVYGPNEVRTNVAPYADFFPGHDVVDALATDVYSNGFARHDYDSLLALAAGKPIGLGEVGPIPTAEILQDQPRWAWFVAWYDLQGIPRETRAAVKATFDSPVTMNWDELPWVNIKHPTVHYPVIK
ncbi:Mannan endo-1,4-beta-mannosidase [Lacunisphaera limnophila]|uniref:Mannan endo-1,4-beta-mannosidase n=1 Tax=Lacunisphaera limnophila TaxID=1838286 RepID=A0A1D8AV70_9BACT|nr:glycosyl hydrolase [Lacunisphaera limnophila]AOS44736.1 Mannan endo-1,4-beta-mannosidase [Lacunisphaera limnophila]